MPSTTVRIRTQPTRLGLCTALVAVLALSLSCSKDEPTAPHGFTITGQVRVTGYLVDENGGFLGTRYVDDASGVPVELVYGTRVIATTTTEGGRYTFTGLSPGGYFTRTELLGHELDHTDVLTVAVTDIESRDTLHVTSFGDLRPVPNPLTDSNVLYYSLPDTQLVDIRVRDLLGQTIRTLFVAHRPDGLNQIWWDGLDATGRPLTAPILWATLESPDGLRAQILFR